jgi:hypothetical protein
VKSLLIGALALSALSIPAWAQQKAELVTLGPNRASAANQVCVDVEIGGQRAEALDCLNLRLRQTVAGIRPPANIPPVQASSPAVRAGGFNAAALSQQYGQNLGKSVVPYRPVAAVFANSLRP